MITNIQLLRGIAALMVVIFHLAVKFQPFGYDGSQVAFLQAGVDIFFVISGFIMVYVSHHRERSAVRFLTDRIIRIVPLYWLLTFTAFALVNERSSEDLLKSLLFIPNGIPPLFNPLIDGGWTLNLEMYFYCLFAAGLAFFRSEQSRFALVVALLTAVVAVSLWMPGRYWKFYGNQIVFEFVIGMILARSGELIRAIEPLLAWGMAALALVLIVAQPFAQFESRLLSDGMPAGLLVSAALSLDHAGQRIGSPSALLLGAISYALYLSHELVFTMLRTWIVPLGPDAAPALVLASTGFALTAALLIAWLIYAAFEKPATGLLKRSMGTDS